MVDIDSLSLRRYLEVFYTCMASLELAIWGSYADLKAEVVNLWGYKEGAKNSSPTDKKIVSMIANPERPYNIR